MPVPFAAAIAAALALTSAQPTDAQVVKLKLVSEGMSKALGYYAPQRITLSAERPDAIKKAPADLAAPLYGKLPITGLDGEEYHLVIGGGEDKPARMFVDADGDGDLTDDPEVELKANAAGTSQNADAMLDLGRPGKPYKVHINMYRTSGSAGLQKSMQCYRDYGAEGEVKLGGKTYEVKLIDENVTGDFRGKEIADDDPKARSGATLVIDVNGNGKVERVGEKFDVRKPFNIGGVTYELTDVARDGLSFKVRRSNKSVDAVALPPDHTVGAPITAFEAKTMDGKNVRFPGDYKGKVVLLDFWATWCGPCMKEMPNVAAAYKEFNDKGFEVLGVSFDREKAEDKIKKVTADHEMPWPQVYEGKYWDTKIGKLYAITGIPATYLVDGDTGKVIAANLRGEALSKAVEEALGKKGRK